MGYKNIFIAGNTKISTKNEQLVLEQDTLISIPLEDINCIMIENMHTLISSYCFSKFSEYNIVVYFCNQQHIPSSYLLPFCCHSRHASIFALQSNTTKPMNKQLWQNIIRCKIKNQAICYSLLGSDSKYLYTLENKVLSGDSTNVEAIAAAYYFKGLYGKDFRRREQLKINACLNYGYAIIRGFVARSIVAHGLEPSIGIFHHNDLNSFNLADDFLEPFRAFVDYYVIQKVDFLGEELTSKDKKVIFEMLKYCIVSDKQEQTIANAVDMLICSYVRILKKEDTKLLLPNLIELKQYEFQ